MNSIYENKCAASKGRTEETHDRVRNSKKLKLASSAIVEVREKNMYMKSSIN